MRQSVEDTIREKVRALLLARPDISHAEFGEAIGRGYAWVHAFLKGIRHANDIRLVVRIARYFSVSVGYLLNETDRGRDAGAMLLLNAWDGIDDPRHRQAVLNLALEMKGRTVAPDSEPFHESPHARGAEGGTKPAPKKRR